LTISIAVFAASAPRFSLLRIGALNGLSHGIGGEDAEDDRDIRIHRGLQNPSTDFGADVLEMRRITTDHCAETDHRIESTGPGKLASHEGNFKRARYPHHLDGLVRHAGFRQRLHALRQ
jgi:hypothetical protein